MAIPFQLDKLPPSSEPGLFSHSYPIEVTKAMYKELGKFKRANNLFRKFRTDERLVIYPGVASMEDGKINPDYVRFLLKTHEDLTVAFPPSERKDGIMDGDAIPTNWNSMLSYPGHYMSPLGYPALDNTSRTRTDFVSQRDRDIAREVGGLLFQTWELKSSLPISKFSSGGFPEMKLDAEWKKDTAMAGLKNAKKIASNMVAGKLHENYRDHKVLAAGSIGYRMSNDSAEIVGNKAVPKPRTAPNYRIARGVPGDVPIANRDIDGHPMLFRKRSRVFHAHPGTLNYHHQALVKGFIDSFTTRYERAYKVRSRQDLLNIWQGKFVIGLDAGQFDQSYGRFVIDLFFDMMAEALDPTVVAAMKLQMQMPLYAPSPILNEPGFGVFFGSPYNLADFRINVGVPSGIFLVSMINKWWGTCIALFAMDRVGRNVLGRVEEILEHKHPDWALGNNGDDSIVGAKTRTRYQQLVDHIRANGSEYCDLEVEDAIRYSGILLYSSGGQLRAAPDPHTYIGNWHSPERSLSLDGGGFFRRFWEVGYLARNENFMDHPHGGEIKEIVTKNLVDIFDFNPDVAAQGYSAPSDSELYTIITSDPTKLQWRYDEQDVPEYIRSPYMYYIAKEELEPWCEPLLTRGIG